MTPINQIIKSFDHDIIIITRVMLCRSGFFNSIHENPKKHIGRKSQRNYPTVVNFFNIQSNIIIYGHVG